MPGSSAPSKPAASLPPTVLHLMETTFGKSLDDVRIHEGYNATMAGAKAYTQGNDIHFAPGEYQPFTKSGLALLAHELAHVIQQSALRAFER